MANAALTVVGLLLSGISAIPTLQSFFAPDPGTATNVRVVIGTSTNATAASFSGNTPGAALWDFNGHAIGFAYGKGDVVLQGNPVDIPVFPRADAGKIQAEYVSITNGGDDAICIAGTSLTFAQGLATAAFSTDVAFRCGAFWANSHTPVLGTPQSGELADPVCIWLDRDASFGLIHQGMAFHLPSFSSANQNLAASYQANNDLMCKSGPRFRMYEKLKSDDNIIVFPKPPEFVTKSDDPTLIGTDLDPGFIINNPGVPSANLFDGTGGPVSRARLRQKRHKYQDHALAQLNNTLEFNGPISTQDAPRLPLAHHLIISPHVYNSARRLCESRTSYGHSFVSLPEGLFCDMTAKVLYHMCSDEISSCCLDTDTASFRACHEGSTLPPNNKINGTSIQPVTVRARAAGHVLVTAMTKGDKAYDIVQRW